MRALTYSLRSHCRQLRALPPSLGDWQSLQVLDLVCGPSKRKACIEQAVSISMQVISDAGLL